MVSYEKTGHKQNPLSRHPLLKSSDIEETREFISRNFSPHSLEVLSEDKSLRTQIDGVFFNNTALFSGVYSADIRVNPESNKYFFTQTTLTGNTEVLQGRQVCQTKKGSTVVVSPSADYQVRLQKGSSRLIVMLEREALERQLSLMLNRNLKDPLLFDLSMKTGEQHAAWTRTLSYLCDQFSLSAQVLDCESFLRHSSNMLMSLLLEIQPHNYSSLLHEDAVDKSPRHVRRAIDYIEEHIQQPISLVDLASEVGVTTRTLQKGFMRFTERTPSEYIRIVRINKIHEALLAANPEQRVTEVLLQYGVSSFGHFSRSYKNKYGCTPSETLKKN